MRCSLLAVSQTCSLDLQSDPYCILSKEQHDCLILCSVFVNQTLISHGDHFVGSAAANPCLTLMFWQDLIRVHQKQLVRLLEAKNGVLYVCGDANNMAKDVMCAVQQAFQTVQQIDETQAKSRILQLQQEKRYLQDIWTWCRTQLRRLEYIYLTCLLRDFSKLIHPFCAKQSVVSSPLKWFWPLFFLSKIWWNGPLSLSFNFSGWQLYMELLP